MKESAKASAGCITVECYYSVTSLKNLRTLKNEEKRLWHVMQ